MDTMQDIRYIVVAELKDNSSEIVLNVYDVGGHITENEIVSTIKEETDDVLNEVYKSLVTYKKEGILQNKLMVENNTKLFNVLYDGGVELKCQLEESNIKQEVIEKNFNIYCTTTKNDNDFIDSLDVNKFVGFGSPALEDSYYLNNKELAYSYWLKFRKILNDQGIMINNKKEISIEHVTTLNSLSNEKKDKLIQKLVGLLEQQVLPHIAPDMSICFLNNNGNYQCKHCSLEEPCETLIQHHYKATHGSRYHICLACDSCFQSERFLHKHEVRCTGKLAHLIKAARKVLRGNTVLLPRNKKLCPDCGKLFRPNNMRAHRKIHENMVFYCSLCTATFRSAITCEAHERGHNGLRPYKCSQCPRAYTSRTSLQTHKETHASGFTCDVCGKCFNRKYTLIKHLDTHRELMDFDSGSRHPCVVCGKVLSCKNSLRNHMQRHSRSPSLHSCTQCDKRYPAIYTLRAHMKTKHGTNIVTRKTGNRNYSLRFS